MPKITYDLTIEKNTDAQCDEAAVAVKKILKALPHDDLIYLADLAVKKPNFVKKAKPYVNLL